MNFDEWFSTVEKTIETNDHYISMYMRQAWDAAWEEGFTKGHEVGEYKYQDQDEHDK